jgi:hypothetical protein
LSLDDFNVARQKACVHHDLLLAPVSECGQDGAARDARADQLRVTEVGRDLSEAFGALSVKSPRHASSP